MEKKGGEKSWLNERMCKEKRERMKKKMWRKEGRK